MREYHPFEPFVPAGCRFLLLGSFPGGHSTSGASAQGDWYYSSPRNQFWRIMGSLFPQRMLKDRLQRQQLCIHLRMAVADVILSCERVGGSNLDSRLRKRVYNIRAVEAILENESLEALFCTGKGVADLFRRHFRNPGNVPVVALPSPSPAMFRMSMEEKVRAYRELFLRHGVGSEALHDEDDDHHHGEYRQQ